MGNSMLDVSGNFSLMECICKEKLVWFDFYLFIYFSQRKVVKATNWPLSSPPLHQTGTKQKKMDGWK